MDNNLQTAYDAYGRIITSDTDLNKIIRAVENEKGKMAVMMPAVTFDEDPDEKVYLVLLKIYVEDNFDDNLKDWQIKTGRQTTYDYLKDLVKHEIIDPNESFVIAGTSEFEEVISKDNITFESKPITVFRFLKVMYDNHKVLDSDEDFDINEFDPCNWDKGDKTILEI